jgi:hypothetical protein
MLSECLTHQDEDKAETYILLDLGESDPFHILMEKGMIGNMS